MTIKQLKQELEKYPEDADIIMSKDAEGNDYRFLYLVVLDKYTGKSSDFKFEYGKEELLKNGKDCAILFPE